MHPSAGPDRVAAGVHGRAVEVDAAAQHLLVLGSDAGDLTGIGGAMHARDQQALPATGREQLDAVDDP
jgi:hypothetical protein